MTAPNVKAIESKEHTCKQGHYVGIVPKITYEKHVSRTIWGRQDRAFN